MINTLEHNAVRRFFTARNVLWFILAWQAIAVYLIALGVWPQGVAWVNFALVAGYIVVSAPYDSLLLLIVSIPFFIVLPNPLLSGFPMWRLLFIELFGMWVLHLVYAQRQYLKRTFFRRFVQEQKFNLEHREPDLLLQVAKRVDSRFFTWEKYFVLFFLVSAVSLFLARYPFQSLKQIIFVVNVYLLYQVCINVVTSKAQIIEVIKFTAISSGIIVFIGYVQFIATFFTTPYYFWQYWATLVSKAYYGQDLANVLVYSNSWFSYSGKEQSLRMFSIMPDSHSFAMVAVIAMVFLISLTYLYVSERKVLWRKMYTQRNYYVWNAIRLSGLAIILSGTRGIWVGMLGPLVVSGWLYVKNVARSVMKKFILSGILIILLFALAPAFNHVFNLLRFSRFEENFLQRAASIYDLSEESNVGRIEIWKNSIKYSLSHPFGIGYGNFVVSLVDNIPPGTPFKAVGEQHNLRYNLPQKFVSAHSLYLSLLVELGFAGLLAFGLFWLEYFMEVWRFLKSIQFEVTFFSAFVMLLTLTFIWFLAYGVFDVTLFNDKVLMYFFISLALCGLIMRKYRLFYPEGVDSKE